MTSYRRLIHATGERDMEISPGIRITNVMDRFNDVEIEEIGGTFGNRVTESYTNDADERYNREHVSKRKRKREREKKEAKIDHRFENRTENYITPHEVFPCG